MHLDRLVGCGEDTVVPIEGTKRAEGLGALSFAVVGTDEGIELEIG